MQRLLEGCSLSWLLLVAVPLCFLSVITIELQSHAVVAMIFSHDVLSTQVHGAEEAGTEDFEDVS